MYNPIYLKIREQGIKLYLNTICPYVMKRRARKIGKKDKIEVVFFAMNLALWRYQGVYELMSRDERFNCHIVFTAASSFTDDQISADHQQLRDYFEARSIPYIDYDLSSKEGADIKQMFDPDILFYPQPYGGFYPLNHEFEKFISKLWIYITYAVNVVKDDDWIYDTSFHSLAWKVYCTTEREKQKAEMFSRNRGRNWVVSGYANIDRYCSDQSVDVWKIKDKSVKRLIWAPHFTITKGISALNRSNFLWMAQLMLDVANQYKDSLQIAFKPHPRLKSELYKNSEWGKEKTDAYYQKWNDQANTQLETGDFVDLFKTSDAMVHDSGSFTAEYLYVNKPVAFVTKDINQLMEDHNDFGQAALKEHYILENQEDVLTFIKEVVLDGLDSKSQQRKDFFNQVLRPIATGTTSQFIVNDIKRSLGITD